MDDGSNLAIGVNRTTRNASYKSHSYQAESGRVKAELTLRGSVVKPDDPYLARITFSSSP